MRHVLTAILGLMGLLLCPGVAFSTCTMPYTLTNGATADATQVMANFNSVVTCLASTSPAGGANALQINGGSGAFGSVGPLTNGQILIGSTLATPLAATLTAGSGISITNGPGTITIAQSGGGGSAMSPFFPSGAINTPAASAFTLNVQTGYTGGATDMASGRGIVFTTSNGGQAAMEQAVPSGAAFTATAMLMMAGGVNGTLVYGMGIKDTTGAYVVFSMNFASNQYMIFARSSINSGSGANATYGSTFISPGPIWERVQLTSGNFVWSVSFDGENFLPLATVAQSAWVGATLADVGLFTLNATALTAPIDLLSWTVTTP